MTHGSGLNVFVLIERQQLHHVICQSNSSIIIGQKPGRSVVNIAISYLNYPEKVQLAESKLKTELPLPIGGGVYSR